MKHAILLVTATVLLTGCQITINSDNCKTYGQALTRTYSLTGQYHELEVSHAFSVTMSDTVTVPTVTLDSALHERLLFRIEDGTLKIGLKPGTICNMHHSTVLLPYNPDIDDIDISGASSFTALTPLSAKKISIELSGASNFNGSLLQPADMVDIDLSGASTAVISGTTNVFDINISGASNLDATNLDATTVTGSLSGASMADVLCCERLKVYASGASNLTYRTVADGCTPEVNCSTSGSSTVSIR